MACRSEHDSLIIEQLLMSINNRMKNVPQPITVPAYARSHRNSYLYEPRWLTAFCEIFCIFYFISFFFILIFLFFIQMNWIPVTESVTVTVLRWWIRFSRFSTIDFPCTFTHNVSIAWRNYRVHTVRETYD